MKKPNANLHIFKTLLNYLLNNPDLFSSPKSKAMFDELSSIWRAFKDGKLDDQNADLYAKRLISLTLLLASMTRNPKAISVAKLLKALHAEEWLSPYVAKALVKTFAKGPTAIQYSEKNQERLKKKVSSWFGIQNRPVNIYTWTESLNFEFSNT